MMRILMIGTLFCSLVVVGYASAPRSVFAQATSLGPYNDLGLNAAYQAGQVGEFAKKGGKDAVAIIAGNILRIILQLLALFSMVVFIGAGALWMNARGNEEDVSKAKEMLKYAFVGILVAFAGYAAVTLVTNELTTRVSFFGAQPVYAQSKLGDSDLGLTNTAQEAQLIEKTVKEGSKTDIALYVGRVIEFILAGLGLFFLILIVLAGLKWLLAEGNEEAIDKAKSSITQAVWGMLIIAAAYTITNFMVSVIEKTALGT